MRTVTPSEISLEIELRGSKMTAMAAAVLTAVSALHVSTGRALPLRARVRGAIMGVSDRTANDGLLYEGWGAEGMRVLNSTASFQQVAEGRGVSRYDQVLIVAARAKENAYNSADDDAASSQQDKKRE